ncbi:MAG: hypothetical protein NC191_07025 [Muribaculaceae bacterium]|nr:hypothetical protein [Muribaculaceae bacterium]
MTGFFKIWRELFDKPIWLNSTPEQKVILITILKMANWKENKWEWKGKPYHCKPGEFITSYDKIAKAGGKGISRQNVRTALKRFEKLEFLTDLLTDHREGGIKVIIRNWEMYQNETNTPSNRPLTHHQHTPNRPLTPIEEYKKERIEEYKKNNISCSSREEKEENDNCKLYGEYSNIYLSSSNYGKLLAMCASEKLLNQILDEFSGNIEIGKEEPYKADFPNAHFERLRRYYNYRKQNPDKFDINGQRIAYKTKDEAFIEAQERQRAAVRAAFAELESEE